MTQQEAAIVTAYTGVLIGDIRLFHSYMEGLMGRPVLTHELASGAIIYDLKEKARDDFLAIVIEDAP